jgi:hypothetical protein
VLELEAVVVYFIGLPLLDTYHQNPGHDSRYPLWTRNHSLNFKFQMLVGYFYYGLSLRLTKAFRPRPHSANGEGEIQMFRAAAKQTRWSSVGPQTKGGPQAVGLSGEPNNSSTLKYWYKVNVKLFL